MQFGIPELESNPNARFQLVLVYAFHYVTLSTSIKFSGEPLGLRVVHRLAHYPRNLMRIIPTKGEKR